MSYLTHFIVIVLIKSIVPLPPLPYSPDSRHPLTPYIDANAARLNEELLESIESQLTASQTQLVDEHEEHFLVDGNLYWKGRSEGEVLIAQDVECFGHDDLTERVWWIQKLKVTLCSPIDCVRLGVHGYCERLDVHEASLRLRGKNGDEIVIDRKPAGAFQTPYYSMGNRRETCANQGYKSHRTPTILTFLLLLSTAVNGYLYHQGGPVRRARRRTRGESHNPGHTPSGIPVPLVTSRTVSTR